MSEIWKDIEGYEGLYQVSNYGRVRSLDRYVKQNHNTKQLKKGKLIQPIKDCKGYLRLKLCKENTSKRVKIHRLVAQAFIPNPENKPQVNHIDGNKTNNRIQNLEWCTNSENQIHAYKMGLNKITEEQRRKISQRQKGRKVTEKEKRIKRENAKNKKKVKCINTGEIFKSIMDASRKTGIDSAAISKVCRKLRQSAGKHPITGEKLKWEYME